MSATALEVTDAVAEPIANGLSHQLDDPGDERTFETIER